MDRLNEFRIRAMVATAERHGWRYCGADEHGYYVSKRLKSGRMVALLMCRATMRASVSAN